MSYDVAVKKNPQLQNEQNSIAIKTVELSHKAHFPAHCFEIKELLRSRLMTLTIKNLLKNFSPTFLLLIFNDASNRSKLEFFEDISHINVRLVLRCT
jgi:hypothetical protein